MPTASAFSTKLLTHGPYAVHIMYGAAPVVDTIVFHATTRRHNTYIILKILPFRGINGCLIGLILPALLKPLYLEVGAEYPDSLARDTRRGKPSAVCIFKKPINPPDLDTALYGGGCTGSYRRLVRVRTYSLQRYICTYQTWPYTYILHNLQGWYDVSHHL